MRRDSTQVMANDKVLLENFWGDENEVLVHSCLNSQWFPLHVEAECSNGIKKDFDLATTSKYAFFKKYNDSMFVNSMIQIKDISADYPVCVGFTTGIIKSYESFKQDKPTIFDISSYFTDEEKHLVEFVYEKNEKLYCTVDDDKNNPIFLLSHDPEKVYSPFILINTGGEENGFFEIFTMYAGSRG